MKSERKLRKDFQRPWGGFIRFVQNKPCTVKILFIKRGGELSLQSHKLRDELWYIIEGKVKVSKGLICKCKSLKEIKENLHKITLRKGENIVIPRLTIHNVKALVNSKILEISTGKFHEKDEVRYDDIYGRK